jgi:hypothetical protein
VKVERKGQLGIGFPVGGLDYLKKILKKAQVREFEKNYSKIKDFLSQWNLKPLKKFFLRKSQLPPFCKEYWFLHFVSGKKQLIATFGHAFPPAKVGKTIAGAGQSLATVVWFFDGKKLAPIDCNLGLENESEGIRLRNGSKQVSLESRGKTGFRLSCSGNGFSGEFDSKPLSGLAFDAGDYTIGPLGYRMLNYYQGFSGGVNGKKWAGKCYLQKILGAGPFLQWKWGRIYFEKGYILDFFSPDAPPQVKEKPFARLAVWKSGKLVFETKKVEIENKGREWKVELPEISFKGRTYSRKEFRMESLGKFSYWENLVEARECWILEKGKKVKLEGGYGICEDTRGAML